MPPTLVSPQTLMGRVAPNFFGVRKINDKRFLSSQSFDVSYDDQGQAQGQPGSVVVRRMTFVKSKRLREGGRT